MHIHQHWCTYSVAHGCTWMHMDAHGCTWMHMDAHSCLHDEHSCLLMNIDNNNNNNNNNNNLLRVN